MAKLAPIKLDDFTTIYIESSEDIEIPKDLQNTDDEEESLRPRGITDEVAKQFKSIRQTIRSYTSHTLDAFKAIASANVDKVTMEFGIKVGGEAGIPYVTKGTAESNLKITVECSFPNETTGQPNPSDELPSTSKNSNALTTRLE